MCLCMVLYLLCQQGNEVVFEGLCGEDCVELAVMSDIQKVT